MPTAQRIIKVLLVEDNAAEANLVKLELSQCRSFDVHIQWARSIADAEARLQVHDFDVVILDFNLPDCDDLSGLQRVLDKSHETAVVMLTSLEDETLATEAVSHGAQDYLYKKDLSAATLERSVRYAIERQSIHRALKVSEERYALAMAGVNDGIWDWDIKAGHCYMSDRLYEMLGYETGYRENDKDYWLSRIHTDDRDSFERVLNAHMVGAIPYLEVEFRLNTNDDQFLWVLCRGLAIRDSQGNPVRMAGSVSDISRRKLVEEQLIHDALHDGLTGLPNRTLFLDRVQQKMEVATRRPDHRFAVIFIDLNRFKSINDSLGHTAGNNFLRAVAERLDEEVRPTDTLARLGGDEFALLVNSYADVDAVFGVAERIHQRMAEKFLVDGAELYSGASIGIATHLEKYRLPEEILRDADIAMYRAKRTGAAFEVFDAHMHELAMRRLSLETDLRNALEDGQFEVYYQPILDTDSGTVVAFEALLRWHHPRAGLIYPDTFIKVAEDTGLVIPIGWWVIEQAVKDFARLRGWCPEADAIGVSVNISGKIFNNKDIALRLGDILSRHDFNSRALSLEITEHAVMDHQYQAIKALRAVRDLGVGLHIDDFGTGYSSLSHLQKFSYDTLKIDSSFVHNAATCSDNEAIVRSIIAMGKLLGMDIVAEGVETLEQLRWLKKMGCPKVQGFLFSEAIPCSQINQLLSQMPQISASG